MTKPADRRKKKKFVKTIKKTKEKRVKSTAKGKKKCSLCKTILHGTAKNIKKILRKTPKSKRVPNAPFAGILCNKCRTKLIEEAIKVKTGIKKMDETEIKERKYIEILLKKIK